MIDRLRNIGPGAMVSAAFIGPGTVTACTLAGVNFGYALLWALVFATFATIVLQEMAARLGVITKQGLGENLATLFDSTIWKWPLIILVGLALYLGNSAYEAGNLAGAALGISAIAGESAAVFNASIVSISILASGLLLAGTYKQVERFLLVLVAIMAVSFVATFAIVRPDLAALFRGVIIPIIPDGALLTVVALIGTTVVPYNLFLHSTAVRNKWTDERDLGAARADTAIAIGIGGIIAILIASTAAASLFASGLSADSAGDFAKQFEPLFGSGAKYVLGLGLFAAGLTSAITAPLATGYAMTEILQVKGGQQSRAFRMICISVIVIGACLSLTGIKPVEIIVTAQFANGLLLPVIGAFLFYAVNRTSLLGKFTNGWLANCLGAAVLIITIGLGARLVISAIL